MALYTAVKIVNSVHFYNLNVSSMPADGSFMALVFTANILAKCLASIALQIILIVHRFELAALVECLLGFTKWHAPSLRSWRGMTLVLMGYWSSSFILPYLSVADLHPDGMTSKAVSYGLGDMIPTFQMSLSESAFAAVLAACAFLGRDTADDIQKQVRALARQAH
ncbi:uncharacterized protein LOC117644291 [Thrips palmi]|uniref:Uncharacterized protein LOC117644291 n=1 Tax=Thrips palmi TaxID=161013 RepID=A0A6P8ZLV5_THRPL|nr:uncharacterized protein LOC117644291 [Thrips palmi]